MTTNKSVISIQGQPIGKKEFMSAIDQEIITLHDTGDVNRVMKVLDGLDSVEGITGHAKAKLLYSTNEWWKQNKEGENFSDHVESTTNLKKVTVDRYVLVWKYVEDLTIPKEIAERPMRDLVPIAKTIAQGYEMGKAEWRKIGLTASDGELREVLRNIKGKAERKSARVIKMARDGSLYGYKNNQKYFIGYLNIKEAEQDIVLAEFIEKIKISSGVIDE